MRYVLYIKGEWTIISERKDLRSESMRRKKKIMKESQRQEKKQFSSWLKFSPSGLFSDVCQPAKGKLIRPAFHCWLTITHLVYILTDSEYSIKLSFDKITMISLEGRMYRTPLSSFWAQLHAGRDACALKEVRKQHLYANFQFNNNLFWLKNFV